MEELPAVFEVYSQTTRFLAESEVGYNGDWSDERINGKFVVSDKGVERCEYSGPLTCAESLCNSYSVLTPANHNGIGSLTNGRDILRVPGMPIRWRTGVFEWHDLVKQTCGSVITHILAIGVVASDTPGGRNKLLGLVRLEDNTTSAVEDYTISEQEGDKLLYSIREIKGNASKYVGMNLLDRMVVMDRNLLR